MMYLNLDDQQHPSCYYFVFQMENTQPESQGGQFIWSRTTSTTTGSYDTTNWGCLWRSQGSWKKAWSICNWSWSGARQHHISGIYGGLVRSFFLTFLLGQGYLLTLFLRFRYFRSYACSTQPPGMLSSQQGRRDRVERRGAIDLVRYSRSLYFVFSLYSTCKWQD